MNYDLTYVPVHVMFKKVVLEVIDLAVPSLFKFPPRQRKTRVVTCWMAPTFLNCKVAGFY